MRTLALAATSALLALSACGGGGDAPGQNVAEAPQSRPVPLSKKDPEAYHDNVETAMAEVPASLRGQFKQLLVCTLKKDQQTNSVRPLSADLVRELTARIKADPAAATAACQVAQ